MIEMTNKYFSIIDTLKIRVKLLNVNDFTKITQEEFPYIISRNIDIEEGSMILGMSLNRRKGHYNRLTTLSDHLVEFDAMIQDFNIENGEDLELNRVDIAIDTNLDYYENFKFILYMFELITYGNKKSDKWYTTNLETLQENSIKEMGRHREISFYDKHDESKGRHKYDCRMEIRYLDLTSLDFKKHINKLVDLINSIEQNIELLDKNMANRLIRLYGKEMNNGNVKSLSEYVRKFNKYIYTNEVMKKLYDTSELDGDYNNWVKKFRQSNKLEFISKANVKRYRIETVKSLNYYKNN